MIYKKKLYEEVTFDKERLMGFQFSGSYRKQVSISKNYLNLSNCDDRKFDRNKDEEANKFFIFILSIILLNLKSCHC